MKQFYINPIPFDFGLGAAKYFKENIDGTLTDKAILMLLSLDKSEYCSLLRK